jgi:hypothetical protein
MSQNGQPIAVTSSTRTDCPQCNSTAPPVVTLLTSWQRFQRCEQCGFVSAIAREDVQRKGEE